MATKSLNDSRECASRWLRVWFAALAVLGLAAASCSGGDGAETEGTGASLAAEAGEGRADADAADVSGPAEGAGAEDAPVEGDPSGSVEFAMPTTVAPNGVDDGAQDDDADMAVAESDAEPPSLWRWTKSR